MKFSWKNCLQIAATLFVLYLCVSYWHPLISLLGKVLSAAAPIGIGFVIAYIINILMSFFERHYFRNSQKTFIIKSRRYVCLIIAVLTMCGALALLCGILLPSLISCGKFFVSEVPEWIRKIISSDFVKTHVSEDLFNKLSSINWQELVKNSLSTVVTGIGGVAGFVFSTLSSVFTGIVDGFVSIIFAFYFLISKDALIAQLQRFIKNYLPRKLNVRLLYYSKVTNDSFHKYFVGQFIEAIILGVLCTIGMLIFRFPYAGMIGTLIGFTALIPIAGAYIGCAVGALMIMTESPLQAILFVVFIIVLQQLEGNLIYPKVVGNSLGLPGLWVLAAVIVGGSLAGILGMLIGVPITATVYKLIKTDLRRRERIHAIQAEKKNS